MKSLAEPTKSTRIADADDDDDGDDAANWQWHKTKNRKRQATQINKEQQQTRQQDDRLERQILKISIPHCLSIYCRLENFIPFIARHKRSSELLPNFSEIRSKFKFRLDFAQLKSQLRRGGEFAVVIQSDKAGKHFLIRRQRVGRDSLIGS